MRSMAAVCVVLVGLGLVAAPARAVENRHAVAVIIGNQTYQGRTPAVDYAHNDAAAIKRYVIDILGYREGNIIDLRDATFADFRSVFGDDRNPEGKLFDWIRPGKSDVTVFYSGHGVPGLEDRNGYLLPVNGDASRAEITGYPLDLLYSNLGKIGARSVTVLLDTCFSGETPNGTIIHGTSGLNVTPKEAIIPTSLTVLTAARGDQVANWDEEAKHGLFTEYLLRALYGEADGDDFGNGDGLVTLAEVRNYLNDEMSYQARRRYGRKQTPTIKGDEAIVLAAFEDGVVPERPSLETFSSSSFGVANLVTMDDSLYAQKDIKVRQEPRANSVIVTRLKKGVSVTVIGRVQDANWYLIEEEGVPVGYIYGDLLADDPPQLASLATSSQSTGRSVRVFNITPVTNDGEVLHFANDIIRRTLAGVANSTVSGTAAQASDTIVSATIVRFERQEVKNPEYEGAQIANAVFGGLLSGLTENIKPFVTVFDVEVVVSSSDGLTGEVTSAFGRSMIRGDGFETQNAAAIEALKQAFSDGARRFVIRLSGGVSPAWQPPELFASKDSSVTKKRQD